MRKFRRKKHVIAGAPAHNIARERERENTAAAGPGMSPSCDNVNVKQ